MSKYNILWEYVQRSGKESFQLTFELLSWGDIGFQRTGFVSGILEGLLLGSV